MSEQSTEASGARSLGYSGGVSGMMSAAQSNPAYGMMSDGYSVSSDADPLSWGVTNPAFDYWAYQDALEKKRNSSYQGQNPDSTAFGGVGTASERESMIANATRTLYNTNDPGLKKAIKAGIASLAPLVGLPGVAISAKQIYDIINLDKETRGTVEKQLQEMYGLSEEEAKSAVDQHIQSISEKSGDPTVSARSALGGNAPDDVSFQDYVKSYTQEVTKKNESISNIASLVGGLSDDEKSLLDQITSSELKLFESWWSDEKAHWEAAMGARGLITPESVGDPEAYKSTIFGDELGAFQKTGALGLTSLIGNAATREMDWTKFSDELDYKYKALESKVVESDADRALKQLLAQQQQDNYDESNIWSAVGSIGKAVLGSDWFGGLF